MRKLGPIPRAVHTALGSVPVKVTKKMVDSSGKALDDCLGHCNFLTRKIQILKGLDRVQEHHTLRHEWVHMVLWDAGVTLPEELEERLCDVIATALVAEKLSKVSK